MADIVPMPMDEPRALRLIRELAEDSNRVVLTPHARERMRQRGIRFRQVISCLRSGTIAEGPFMNQHGNWQVTMSRLVAGDEVEVVVAIELEQKLIVITAF